MAKERVQVEGLGRAVPGLQSAVPQLGGYRVQVQETPSWQETKLGQLAMGLGVAVEGARELKAIGDIKEQKAVDELADKSIEDLNKEFLNNRGKLDKEVRKGFLPFMSNPWNQERVRKAAGAQYHDEFQLRLQEALNKSDARTPTDKVVQDVIAGMSEDYESLKDVTIRQGFDAAAKNTIQQYSLRYNSIKNEQNREQLELAGKNIVYRASLDNQGVMADSDAISDWWSENEGAFTPAQLLKLRRDVAMAHARAGDRESFEHWMEFSGDLKVGTTTIKDKKLKTDDVFSDYSSDEAVLRADAENIFSQQQNEELKEGNNILRELSNEAVEISAKLANNQSYIGEDGTLTITNEQEAFEYLRQKALKTGNSYVAGPDAVDRIYQSLEAIRKPKPKEEVFLQVKRILSEVRPQQVGLSFDEEVNTLTNELLTKTEYMVPSNPSDTLSALVVNPKYAAIAGSLAKDMLKERVKIMRQLATGKYKTVEGEDVESTKFQTVVADHMLNYEDDLLSKFRTQLQERLENEKKSEAELKVTTKGAEKYEEGKTSSYVDPTKKVSDAALSFLSPETYATNIFDIEEKLRKGDFEGAVRDADTFEKTGSYPQGLYRKNIDILLDTLESTDKFKAEKDIARRSLVVYMLAKKDKLLTTENINKGSFTLNTTRGAREVPIDREAIKQLLPSFLLISKDRLLALQNDPNEDKTPETQLYEAIFQVSLQEDSEEDENKVRQFIRQQFKVAEQLRP